MKTKISENGVIHVAGGLGNQLFQLAAGRYYFGQKSFKVVSHLNPTQDSGLLGALDTQMYTLSSGGTWLDSKVFNLAIRCSAVSTSNQFAVLVLKGIHSSMEFAISIFRRRRILIQRGIGFDKRLMTEKKAAEIIGYFQSFKYIEAPEVRGWIDTLLNRLLGGTSSVEEIDPRIGKVMSVHVRLGDYLTNSEFGILGSNYYENAISRLQDFQNHDEIWIFSQDPIKARELLPEKFKNKYVFFPELNSDALATFHKMRQAHSFVIANSTFSWWAAFMAFDEKARVLYPKQWFRTLENPIDLFPNHWELINIHKENS